MYADIQIVTEGYHDIINGIDFYNYTSKLLMQNVTLDSPYTKFKCQINDTFKEIDFMVEGKRNRMLMPFRMSCSLLKKKINIFQNYIEINNEPVSNFISLEKGTDQNFTCNRWSQLIAIQWFKVNLYFFLRNIFSFCKF
jgi:hypothetical protein